MTERTTAAPETEPKDGAGAAAVPPSQTPDYDQALIAHKLLRWERYLTNYRLPDWKEIPDIGLYMDQMIALLSQYLDFIPLEDQRDKPVTPATINNYVRLRIMPAPEKRKYYRTHIAYLIMIFTLKQSLSLPSIQKVIPLDMAPDQVRDYYSGYIRHLSRVAQFFVQQTRDSAHSILEGNSAGEPFSDPVEQLVTQTILTASFSRLLAEKLIALKGADPQAVYALEREKDGKS